MEGFLAGVEGWLAPLESGLEGVLEVILCPLTSLTGVFTLLAALLPGAVDIVKFVVKRD